MAVKVVFTPAAARFITLIEGDAALLGLSNRDVAGLAPAIGDHFAHLADLDDDEAAHLAGFPQEG